MLPVELIGERRISRRISSGYLNKQVLSRSAAIFEPDVKGVNPIGPCFVVCPGYDLVNVLSA